MESEESFSNRLSRANEVALRTGALKQLSLPCSTKGKKAKNGLAVEVCTWGYHGMCMYICIRLKAHVASNLHVERWRLT